MNEQAASAPPARRTLRCARAPRIAALLLVTAVHLRAQPAAPVTVYARPATVLEMPAGALRLDLDGAGDTEFTRVGTILPRSDGSFLVVNGATLELRFFDAAGKFMNRTGRKGQGPGEYQSISSIALMRGDTLVVLDGITRRLSILSRNGEFVRSVSLAASPDGMGSAERVIPLPSGALLIGFSEITRMAPQPTSVYFWERYYEVNGRDAKFAATDIRLPEGDHFVQATVPQHGGVAYWNLAFGRQTSVRATKAGFVVGTGTDWSVEERSPTGAAIRTHRLVKDVEPVTAADRDAYSVSAMRGTKGLDSVLAAKRVVEMPYPHNKPAYNRVEVDAGGRLWLQAYPSTGDAQQVWICLDPRTKQAAAVRMPPRFRAQAYAANLVYGVWRDADDVEHVRVYALPALR